ncbi:MAG: DUF4760 domain-containing protein [Candidatus Eremiobacteraeota bacterium]|nr:DUF4760 domain-containing protein [Candidatus Eremiobacteraeota bacterium]
MTAEWVGALSNVATLAVILVTAIAAFVQLRHMRSGNQITAMNECRETLESPQFRAAQLFILNELPKRLADPVERRNAFHVPPIGEYEAISQVGNVLEGLGLFVKTGILEADFVCDYWAFLVLRSWRSVAPIIFRARRITGSDAILENFEYLAVLCEDYAREHPSTYPSGVRRMPVDTSLIDEPALEDR